MKKIFKNKVFIFLLIILILSGGGAGAYFLIYKKKNTTTASVEQKEIKVDNLLGYIGSQSDYSKFNTLVGMFESGKYLTKNDAGLEPGLIIFAPDNSAFAKDDMKPFDSMSATARDQIKLYHMTKIYPSAVGAAADLSLKDGQKIITLAGRELTVKKTETTTTITDGKGRDAVVSNKYAVSAKGDRIYFVDSVLLFQ